MQLCIVSRLAVATTSGPWQQLIQFTNYDPQASAGIAGLTGHQLPARCHAFESPPNNQLYGPRILPHTTLKHAHAHSILSPTRSLGESETSSNQDLPMEKAAGMLNHSTMLQNPHHTTTHSCTLARWHIKPIAPLQSIHHGTFGLQGQNHAPHGRLGHTHFLGVFAIQIARLMGVWMLDGGTESRAALQESAACTKCEERHIVNSRGVWW